MADYAGTTDLDATIDALEELLSYLPVWVEVRKSFANERTIFIHDEEMGTICRFDIELKPGGGGEPHAVAAGIYANWDRGRGNGGL